MNLTSKNCRRRRQSVIHHRSTRSHSPLPHPPSRPSLFVSSSRAPHLESDLPDRQLLARRVLRRLMLRQTLVLEHVHERRFPRVIQSLRSRRRQSSFITRSRIPSHSIPRIRSRIESRTDSSRFRRPRRRRARESERNARGIIFSRSSATARGWRGRRRTNRG